MKAIFNGWFFKYLVIFGFVAIIFYGFSYFIYPTPYFYTHIGESNNLVKIDRKTNDVFAFNGASGQWVKINK